MKERLTLFDRMVTAMRTNDLPRLAAIMRKTHEWGLGLKRLVPLLEDASRANRMHFSADERRLEILLYRLAGPAGLNALSAAKLLPSVYHSARWLAEIAYLSLTPFLLRAQRLLPSLWNVPQFVCIRMRCPSCAS